MSTIEDEIRHIIIECKNHNGRRLRVDPQTYRETAARNANEEIADYVRGKLREQLDRIDKRPMLYDAPDFRSGTYLDGIREGVQQERRAVDKKIAAIRYELDETEGK